MYLSRKGHLVFLFLQLAAFLFCAASAEGKTVVWKVPVFYVTDRAPKGDGFGSKRLAENNTVSALRSGIVDVCIPVKGNQSLTEWQKDAEPFATCAKVERLKFTPFKCETAEDLSGQFDSTLAEAIRKSPRKEAFIFVHGFNCTFEDAAQNAARLRFYTGCPVIMYTWPSAEKVYRYSEDECNNEWSQEHFTEFIENIAAVKQSAQFKLNLVAHSMGNRLFVRAMTSPQIKGLFSDVFMVYPDFDAQTFIHYLSRYIPKNGFATGVRGEILVSHKDQALSTAEAVFGGYTRLGQGADFTLSALTRPDLFSNIWGKTKSEAGGQDETSEERKASIKRTVSIVDVTVLDHGLLGHKVPYEYIAWMHQRNRAPEGFELHEDQSRGCNRMSSMWARLCGQKVASPLGSYLIVTKSGHEDSRAVHAKAENSSHSADK